MIKLIASDLDGTLLQNGAQRPSPKIFDLILRLKERHPFRGGQRAAALQPAPALCPCKK